MGELLGGGGGQRVCWPPSQVIGEGGLPTPMKSVGRPVLKVTICTTNRPPHC